MKKLVLHHKYGAAMPWDVSGLGHHGIAKQVAFDAGAFRYDLATSRIDVARRDSLYEMGAFRCSVTFRLKPGQAKRRNNLVEGQLSFALYVGPQATLKTTILDATGDWQGAQAQVPAVYDGKWHRADCGHDGLRTSWIALDGKVVAVRQDVPGPVRPIGKNGISIGHWPEPSDGGYTLAGAIGEVWLWRVKPDPPSSDCCVDADRMALVEQALREHGYDQRKLADLRQDLREAVASLYGSMTPAARGGAQTLSPQLNAALHGQRWPLARQLALQARSLMKAGSPAAARKKADADLAAVLGPLLKDPRIRGSLDAWVCTPTGSPEPPVPTRDPDPFDAPVDMDRPHPGYPPGKKPDQRQHPTRPRGPRRPTKPRWREDEGGRA